VIEDGFESGKISENSFASCITILLPIGTKRWYEKDADQNNGGRRDSIAEVNSPRKMNWVMPKV
jgi:uncharacterized protein with gpF-like domain